MQAPNSLFFMGLIGWFLGMNGLVLAQKNPPQNPPKPAANNPKIAPKPAPAKGFQEFKINPKPAQTTSKTNPTNPKPATPANPKPAPKILSTALPPKPNPAPVASNVVSERSRTDTLWVVVQSGQKFIQHKVTAGESPYLIKSFYGVALTDLYYANPQLENAPLKAGQIVLVPTNNRAIRKHTGMDLAQNPHFSVFYKVKSNETLFKIASDYFNMPIEVLQHRNKLLSEAVYKGQTLHIGWIPKTGIPDSIGQWVAGGLLGAENAKLKQKYETLKLKNKNKNKELLVEGLACWLKGEKPSSNTNLHVLYNAEIGTVLKLENPMFAKKYVYAQVVGKLPENSITEGAAILFSANVAKALGGLDPRFPIRIYQNNL